jgi:hypothetical protein
LAVLLEVTTILMMMVVVEEVSMSPGTKRKTLGLLTTRSVSF